jgi:hypothetical protein
MGARGHHLTLADADSVSASDGREPVVAVGRTRTFDLFLPVAIF